MDLVVEQVEPIARLRLRFEIQLPLQRPDLIRCCQAHRQSPILCSFESAPEVRALPSTGVTQPQQYYDPVRHPHRPSSQRCLEARPPACAGLPQLPGPPFQHAVPITPMDQNGCVCRLLPHSTRAFPVSQAGRRPSLHFRGLLRLHSRYGLPDCSTAQGGLCHEASVQPVTLPNRSSATRSYRQLPGWILPPLVNRAVGAHVESRRSAVSFERSVSPPRSSNAACGFPALRSPTGFIAGIRRLVT